MSMFEEDESRIRPGRDRIVFHSGGQSCEVSLEGLISKRDEHGLLLWGIFMQLAQLNHQVVAQAAQQQLSPDDMMQRAQQMFDRFREQMPPNGFGQRGG